jgi:hypothetical protein
MSLDRDAEDAKDAEGSGFIRSMLDFEFIDQSISSPFVHSRFFSIGVTKFIVEPL